MGLGPVLATCVLVLALLTPHLAAAEEVQDAGQAQTTDTRDPFRYLQWNLDRIGVPAAWEITRGDPDITIALIDTGVDPDHQDLDGALWTDPRTGANGFDHLRGSFSTYESADADWHGTAVAGVAVARTGDGYGIAGVAPEVRLMVHRIYRSTARWRAPNQTSYAIAIQGIDAAVAAGADVLLLTWGGTTPNADLRRAIRESGVPVVVAAGNDGQDLSRSPSIRRYPAMYAESNMVTVAASDRDDGLLVTDQLATNYGVDHVDLAAPGEDIVSLSSGAGHVYVEGSSFAAPHVAGALALARSLRPNVGPADLVAALKRTVRPTSGLEGKVATGGVLDVPAFLEEVRSLVCTDAIPASDFVDVDRGSSHAGSIDCVVFHRIAQGVGGDRFAPTRQVTRGEMATMLVNTLEVAGYDLPTDPPSAFVDTAGTTHEAAIDVLAEVGIARGTGAGRYEPRRTVTRAQMATFVVGTFEAIVGRTLAPADDWFDDDDGSTHERQINVARDLGISMGTGRPRTYDPRGLITREQMASFLANALDALGAADVPVAPRS